MTNRVVGSTLAKILLKFVYRSVEGRGIAVKKSQDVLILNV